MNCDEVRLEALLPMAAVDDGVESAVRHLLACPDCRERLRVMVCLAALQGRREQILKRRGGARWLAAAAALLGLILLAPPLDEQPSPEPGPPSTRAPYPRFPLVTRSRAVRPDTRELGFQAYLEGDFEEAARILRKTDDAEAAFFAGVSLHLLERPGEALAWLARGQQHPRWRRPALWYRANALLDLDRIAEAKEILLDLAVDQGEFRREAEDLLQRLALRPSPKEGR